MAKTTAALDFKSATLYVLRVVLHSDDTAELIEALAQRMREAGAFYENEPVVIDALGLEQAPDWKKLADALRAHQLHPIGVQAASGLLASARKAGLAPLDVPAGRTPAPPDGPGKPAATRPAPASGAGRGRAPAPAAAPVPEPAQDGEPAQAEGATLVIRHPLRSGQRIYARGGDLIVLGMVSQGAEVIADGHIHVYGPLRGKAMAGARGRTDAMILTTQLDPELLAIAGVYRVVETRLPESLHNQPAQVLLEGDSLRIRSLHTTGH
jgi:septum site-determining protein MinC